MQNAKDKKTYGGMFASNNGLYSEKEHEEIKKAPPPAEEDDAVKNMSDAELKARAKAVGIDLVSQHPTLCHHTTQHVNSFSPFS